MYRCSLFLINGQALSAQAQRSPETFCDMSPSCAGTINTIDYMFARVGQALLQKLQVFNAPTRSYKGTQHYFTTGQYLPN